MKLSTLWLREWVEYTLTEQELADQLTLAGLEIDAINPVAGAFSNVHVGHVLATKPHPDADKLTLCEVVVHDNSVLQIVCGAANVRAGLKVAVAMIGACLPGDFKIKSSKLRGQLSEGMLCSASELGLAEHSEGIIELADDAPIGMCIREYLLLDDRVLDVDLTPNRADCFSVLGIAREVAALNQLPLIIPTINAIPPSIDETRHVHLNANNSCARYCGRVIKGINCAAQTPIWLAERLRRSGIRLIHPVVDVMNYVMIELGQPMHAFDLAQLQGDINVRFAHDGEVLELLDGQQINLTPQVLVIADEQQPLALAGVMGGANSSVQVHTRDIFLESAFFQPVTIAGVARKYGLFSDSSQRFERGVDAQIQQKALERATGLILAIAGGEAGPITEVLNSQALPASIEILFNPAKVEQLTGVAIPTEEQQLLLSGLGLVVNPAPEGLFNVQIPSHRFDLHHSVDLVEEIIRLYGYDKLLAQPIATSLEHGQSSITEQRATQLSHWFKNKGYHETISYSFVDPALQESLYPNQEFLQLLNPISSELSQMRAGIWPGLIASMMYNIHRQQNAVKFFEIGVVFDVQNQQLTERPCIAALLAGEQGGLSWSDATRSYDFYDLKGDVESLLSSLHINNVRFVSAPHDALHPGQSAQIFINEQPAGWIGVLHPRIADALGVSHDVLLFELDIHSLSRGELVRYKTISKYPQIRRDLSFLVDKRVSAQQIEDAVRAVISEPWLKQFNVFDVYMGKGIPEGKKSIAIAITLQDASRTLVDNEINMLIDAIIKTLESNFSILLRE